MPLLHLEVKLPPVLTHLQECDELQVTFICLPAAASRTAAFHLANALEEQEHSRGVLVLPLPAHNESEPLNQILCFGGFPGVSEADVRYCATTCGLTVAAVELGSVNAVHERHLVMLAEHLMNRYLGAKGWVRIYDDVYARHSDLFPHPHPPPPPSPAPAPPEPRWNEEDGDSGGKVDFVEAAKIIVSINMRSTQEPWSPEGQLGLTLVLEPMVFKRVHPPFALLQHLSNQHQQNMDGKKQHQQQQKVEADAPDEEGLCGGVGLFPPGEAVLEMRAVRFLPELTTLGLLASLPSPVLELTPLEKANARHGYDTESPRDEKSMRDFWRLAHSLPLPPHPLDYVRVLVRGHGCASITYPAACLVSHFAHNYSRSTQAYTRLSSTFLHLLTALPGVTKAFTTTSILPSSSSLVPVGKCLTSPQKVSPGALKTARQLRDEEQERGGRKEGGMVILVGGGARAAAPADAAVKTTLCPPSSSSSLFSSPSFYAASISRKPPTVKKPSPAQKNKKKGLTLLPPSVTAPLSFPTSHTNSSSLARQQQEDGEGSSSNNNNNIYDDDKEQEDDNLISNQLTGTSAGVFPPPSSSFSSSATKKTLPPPPLLPPAMDQAPFNNSDRNTDEKPKKKTMKEKMVPAQTLDQVLGVSAELTTGTSIKKKALPMTKLKKALDGGGEKKAAAKKAKTKA
ncbi:hypothetical protein VYU27_005496 [Nannochloropsis oceanica]